MKCPFCVAIDTRVLDSRDSAEGTIIRRRRECETCRRRFTTYERVEELNPLVVKKDGRREAFDRDKLISGISKACEKRPVSTDQVDAHVLGIERKLQELGDKEVTSNTIGQMVMEALTRLDEVAYVRFASVYRSFRDIAEFMSELKDILETQGKKPAGKGRSSP